MVLSTYVIISNYNLVNKEKKTNLRIVNINIMENQFMCYELILLQCDPAT